MPLNTYQNILDKLRGFSKRFYSKLLLQGILIFLALGLLFFLVILAVEYFLWLDPMGRLILFWVFLGIELFLLYRFVLLPLLYLFRLKHGLSNKEAALLIGKHFPEVNDKLYNLLELAEDRNRSELLLASIEQRSRDLRPISFVAALDFSESFRYAKYLIFPASILGLIWLSGNLSSFFGSYNRVVNYGTAYEPPAPFVFKVLSSDLNVLENETFTLLVATEGGVRPEDVYIVIAGKEMLLEKSEGMFRYEFVPPLSRTDFYFKSSDVNSKEYTLNVLKVPAIQDFNMILNFPEYTGKESETIKSTGNATFPEGTRVTWNLRSENTDDIQVHIADSSLHFTKEENRFELSKMVYRSMPYKLATSNQNVKDFETLYYQFQVVKDAYPEIKVQQVDDSINPNVSYYTGEASDDYKIKEIALVYYTESDRDNPRELKLYEPNSDLERFYYTFPSGLELQPGKAYEFYFRATDNDAIHGGKSSKSRVFSTVVLDDDQLRNQELRSQQNLINNLDERLDSFKEQRMELNELNKEQREKKQLNFSDQRQIKDFLNKQEQQEAMMEKFSGQLKENLDKDDSDSELKQLLQERLERQKLEAERNRKLLEELSQVTDKIKKEELTKRLEELGKGQQNSIRSLEQLLELTKRYYVTEKMKQLAKDLEKLADDQEELSKLELKKGSEEEQDALNREFDRIKKEMDSLARDNKKLNKPLKLELDPNKQKSIKADQREASEEIKKFQESKEPENTPAQRDRVKRTSEKQRSAARKMREMSQSLGDSASGASSATITEDAEMLRQILDNLVTFSFKQEGLHDTLEEEDVDGNQYGGTVKEQQKLRNLFEHVDDSLFALSLRRAELAEFVNEQITEVYYNMDKSLVSISENQIYQGISYQKYVLNAANSLADFLAKLLDSMQDSMMSGSGSGQGSEFQLPDIIQGQGELNKKIKGMGSSGQGKPQQGEGEGKVGKGEMGDGQKEGNGSQGKDGEGAASGGLSDGDSSGESGSRGNKEGMTGGKGAGGKELGEEELNEIYEIYKEQQLLRRELEKQLNDMINNRDRKLGQRLLRQMEDFENDLLKNGVTERTINRATNIEYELLKLENAAMKQGRKVERESEINKIQFRAPILTRPVLLDNYRNEVEVLSRQALPLRRNFQNKVKKYFKQDD